MEAGFVNTVADDMVPFACDICELT